PSHPYWRRRARRSDVSRSASPCDGPALVAVLEHLGRYLGEPHTDSIERHRPWPAVVHRPVDPRSRAELTDRHDHRDRADRHAPAGEWDRRVADDDGNGVRHARERTERTELRSMAARNVAAVAAAGAGDVAELVSRIYW